MKATRTEPVVIPSSIDTCVVVGTFTDPRVVYASRKCARREDAIAIAYTDLPLAATTRRGRHRFPYPYENLPMGLRKCRTIGSDVFARGRLLPDG